MSEEYRKKTHNVVLTNKNIIVGEPRTNHYQLPPASHAFGCGIAKDKEGAGNVIRSWMPHVPSVRPEDNQQDFKKINKTAAKNGVTNAKQLGEFRQQVDIRVADPSVHKPSKPGFYISKFAHGLKAKPSTPIDQVVGGSYAAKSVERLRARYDNHSEDAAMPNGKYRIKLTKVFKNRIEEARTRRHVHEEEKTSPRGPGPGPGPGPFKVKKVTPRLQLQPISKDDLQSALAPLDDMQLASPVPAMPLPMASSQQQFPHSARGPVREQTAVDELIRSKMNRGSSLEIGVKSNQDTSGMAWQSNQGLSEVYLPSNNGDAFLSSGAIKDPPFSAR